MNIPKIFSKLLLLSFFISLFYVLSIYEDKNQLLIFWINGVTKKEFVHKILNLAIIYFIMAFLLAYFIVPYTQNKARSFIRQSNLDFFPSLIKPKKFIDTVENLTIFLDEKNENIVEKIIIKEDNKNNSQLIIAEKGIISDKSIQKYLKLENGLIIKDVSKEDLQSFTFKSTIFDLSRFKTKTTITPKIQEITSMTIFNCLKNLKMNKVNEIVMGEFNCQRSLEKKLIEELYKRVFQPFFIPLLGMVSCFLILQSNNSFDFKYYKAKIFFSGIFIIVISQVLNSFVSNNFISIIFSIFFPLLLLLLTYLIFNRIIN